MLHEKSGGMTLIELCVVLLVMSIVLALSVPMFRGFNKGNQLHGASQNIAGQLRMARSVAIMSGTMQRFHFYANYSGYDYHVHSGGGGVKVGWKLPKGVEYEWGDELVGVDYMPDGHAAEPLDVIIIDSASGLRDTVTVEMSGYVLVH